MTDRPPDPSDERRHGETAESWWFDFAAADGSLGGYVRLAYRPADGVAWYWAAVVGDGLPLVAFRAHDLRIPARGTEVRGDGVWSCLTCETPWEHWSVGLESFGVVLDDPLDGWRSERGHVVPFGLDLEWEADAPAEGRPNRYGQWCEVHGEVLIGNDRLEVSCRGHREHTWAAEEPSGWRVAVAPRWVRQGEGHLETTWDGDGLPTHARLGSVSLEPRRLSPVAVPGMAVVHALCVGPAWGWVSWWSPS